MRERKTETWVTGSEVGTGLGTGAGTGAVADAGTSAGCETFVTIVEKFCNRLCLINFMHMHAEQHSGGRAREGTQGVSREWGMEGAAHTSHNMRTGAAS